MTEHSKLPVPEDQAVPENQGPDAGAKPRESLIERAAGRFDFTRMMRTAVSIPPVPPVRPLPPVKPVAPVKPVTPTKSEVSAAEAVAESAVEAPVTEAPVQDAIAPVSFIGPRHPIDRERLRDQGLIVPEGAVTALLEEFRIVKRHLLVQAAELRRQNAGAAAQRVLISSPHPGEGKTYCALNLALAIAAEKESEVLLVDADFAKPSILSTLGLPGGHGLMDALMDESIDVADCVLGTDVPGLWVLPAGDTTVNDSEYLGTSRAAQVLARLTEGAPRRIVIFDSPPALAASPAAELAKHVGQVVVIVRADRTGQGALEDAVSLLDGCPNVQLLLNAAQFSPSGRRFGAYYGYSG
ncbi:capsular biosynthesis protein [Novosphingobium sp. BL-8H]|uniref:capsular biosynthesis protein n=1 Tax=Novosphingobium sp. BL-8H TaxID=3127640 RepID=UPI003757BC76